MIDTHCHINDAKFNGETEQIISNFLTNGVEKVICVGCCMQSSVEAMELANQHECVYATVGVHPSDCGGYNEKEFEQLIQNRTKKVVAIGEIGLDYYYGKDNKEQQKQVFVSQIKLAKKYNLPIVIHCRDAYLDCLEILTEHQPYNNTIIMHCYSGSWEFAQRLLKLGVKFSFTGTVTYNNAKNVQEVAKNLPIDSFCLETDCPYLTPVPYRGQRNEPKHVAEIYKFVASLRDMEFEEFEKVIDNNAKKFYNL